MEFVVGPVVERTCCGGSVEESEAGEEMTTAATKESRVARESANLDFKNAIKQKFSA